MISLSLRPVTLPMIQTSAKSAPIPKETPWKTSANVVNLRKFLCSFIIKFYLSKNIEENKTFLSLFFQKNGILRKPIHISFQKSRLFLS